jgi:hypothetical protein
MEIIMNEDQITCLEAYLKIFNGTLFDKPSFYDASGQTSIGSIIAINKLQNADIIKDENDKQTIQMGFGKNNNYMYKDHDYDFNCLFQFANMNKKMVASFFQNIKYNYDVIHDAIHAFYKVGHDYGLFDSMDTISDLSIQNFFKAPYQANGKSNKLNSTGTKVSEINFTDFFKTKKNAHKGKLKSRRLSVYYKFVVKDGEIHPLALVSIPVSINHTQGITLDIHPSAKEFNEKKLIEGLEKLDETLKERIDMILRKELKLKNKFLETLTFEDKLNYLKVAEMAMI